MNHRLNTAQYSRIFILVVFTAFLFSDEAIINFKISKDSPSDVELHSLVGIISEGVLVYQGGTDFTRPLKVNLPHLGKVNICLIPRPGQSTFGISGSFICDLSKDPSPVIEVKPEKSVSIETQLQTSDGKSLINGKISINDVTCHDKGYSAEEVYEGNTTPTGQFSFLGFPGEIYEFKALIITSSQVYDLLSPLLIVGNIAIKTTLTLPTPPTINFEYFEEINGSLVPFKSEEKIYYSIDSDRVWGHMVQKEGESKLFITSRLVPNGNAETINMKADHYKQYEIEPQHISIAKAIGTTIKVVFKKKVPIVAQSKPDNPPILVDVIDANGNHVTDNCSVFLTLLNAQGQSDFQIISFTYINGHYSCNALSSPQIGYLSCALAHGVVPGARFDQREVVIPGKSYQIAIKGTPKNVNISVLGFGGGAATARTFVLVDRDTYLPIDAKTLEPSGMNTLAFALYPGKYRLISSEHNLFDKPQSVGTFEVKDSATDVSELAFKWADKTELNPKEIDEVQHKDFSLDKK